MFTVHSTHLSQTASREKTVKFSIYNTISIPFPVADEEKRAPNAKVTPEKSWGTLRLVADDSMGTNGGDKGQEDGIGRWRQHFGRLLLMGAHTTRSAVESFACVCVGVVTFFREVYDSQECFIAISFPELLASVWRLVGSCFTADDDSEWNGGW